MWFIPQDARPGQISRSRWTRGPDSLQVQVQNIAAWGAGRHLGPPEAVDVSGLARLEGLM